MPKANFGESLNIDRGNNLFTQVKSKGDTITFRLVAAGCYDAKHFSKEGAKWVVTECRRIMNEETCETCERFFELNGQVKKLKEENAPAKEIAKLEAESRDYKPKITFYYPIIDRKDETAKILKTTLSVRLKLEGMFKKGINIFNTDFILENTEKPGSDYYTLDRKDSADVLPLTEKEQIELEKAKAWDLEEMTKSKKTHEEYQEEQPEDLLAGTGATVEPEEQTEDPDAKPKKGKRKEDEHKEDVNPDDIPF